MSRQGTRTDLELRIARAARGPQEDSEKLAQLKRELAELPNLFSSEGVAKAYFEYNRPGTRRVVSLLDFLLDFAQHVASRSAAPIDGARIYAKFSKWR